MHPEGEQRDVTGFLLKLIEMLAAAFLFGAFAAGAPARTLRAWGVGAAVALAAVAAARGTLWIWTPLYMGVVAVSLVMAVLAWRRNRAVLVFLSALYLAWMAQRGW